MLSSRIYPLLLIFLLISCKDREDPQEPSVVPETDLSVSVNHTFDGGNFRLSNESYTIASGEVVKVDRLRYILSNFVLVKSNGQRVTLSEQYALLDPSGAFPGFVLSGIPEGSYTALEFTLGLDSVANHGDPDRYPSGHPLDPLTNDLYWGWSGGYVFMALEGRYGAAEDGFVYHLAFTPNSVPVRLEAPFAAGSGNSITLSLDVAAIFNASDPIHIAVDGDGSHSGGSGVIDQKLRNNLAEAFSLTP